MRSIGEFFAKIQNARAREVMARSAICEAVKKAAGADIEPVAVSFKGGTAVISGLSSSAKAQLHIKKQAILSEIAAHPIAGRAVRDLRFY